MEYDKLDLIVQRADNLLDQFKSDTDIPVYSNALIFLVVIFLILLSLLYVFIGPSQLLFAIALIALIPYKITIDEAAKSVRNFGIHLEDPELDRTSFATLKLRQLESLIALKHTRINAIRFLYIVFFPIWLYMLSRLAILREISWPNEIFFIGLAVLAGTVFWYFYFKPELQKLKTDREDVQEMIVQVSL